MKKRHVIARMIIGAVWLNVMIGQLFAQQTGAEDMAELLRPHIDRFVFVETNVNADQNNVEYTKVRFDHEPIPSGFTHVRAIKFKTPPWPGKLIWSFINDTEEMKGVIGCQTFAAEGEASGFSDMNYETLKVSPPGVTPGYQAVFMEIPTSRLRPDTTYIIHFSSIHQDPYDVWISLNVVPDNTLTYKELFSNHADFKK